MATVNERLGHRACPLCRADLVVRRNAAGTITVSCSGGNGCDFSGFAKKGTKAAELLTAGLAGAAAPPPAPGPAPAPPAPAAKAARQPFSLGNLGS